MINPPQLKLEIIPSPGTENKNFSEIEKKIEICSKFTKTIHIDIVDGIFAPNKTFMDAKAFKKYSKDFFMEVHLMVNNPLQYLESFAEAGFKRFIGHVEKMRDLDEFVAKAQTLGEVGLAVDLPTPVDKILGYIQDLDFAFIMTVKAGFSGQTFSDEALVKIQKIREKDDLIPIEIDGGINNETLPKALLFGASRFVTTNYIFKAKNPSENFQQLEELLQAEEDLD